MCGRINDQISTLQLRALGRRRFVAAEERANTRYYFTCAEWFCDVIIRADFQTHDTIRFFIPSGKNKDRRTRKPVDATQLTANFQTIESRKHQVQDD